MSRLLRRLRHFGRNDDGQVIVVIVAGMLLFLAIAAVVVDGGHAFVVKRSLQNAVDASSLAAAAKLTPGLICDSVTISNATDCDAVKAEVELYLGYNGFSGIMLVPCIRQSGPPENGLIPPGA